jgi:hypothetical protein
MLCLAWPIFGGKHEGCVTPIAIILKEFMAQVVLAFSPTYPSFITFIYFFLPTFPLVAATWHPASTLLSPALTRCISVLCYLISTFVHFALSFPLT